MNKVLVVFSIIASIATGYFWGVSSTQNQRYEDLDKVILFISETLILNDAMDVQFLEHIYEGYNDDPDSMRESIKRHILVMYEESLIKTNLFEETLDLDTRAFKLNDRVKEFIKKYPLEQCKNEIESKRFECSLEAYKDSMQRDD